MSISIDRERLKHWAPAVGLFVLAFAIVIPLLLTRSQDADAHYLTRAAYYVYYDEQSWETLQAEIEHLDIVLPYFFHLTPNGSIKELDPREEEVTAFVKSHNKKIVPIIQNEAKWDDFRKYHGDPAKQQAIVDKLLDLTLERGFDGIQIDFEAINAEDQELITSFMERLAKAFRPRGLIVSQALVARVTERPSVWGGAYDYERLAELNDFVTIMAYDYTSAGSKEPGAVAPIWWVEQVLDFATAKIDPSQIFLGVPFYGRDWNLDEGPPAEGVSFTQVTDRLAKAGDSVEHHFSDEAETPWARYTDPDGDEHEIWYEDSRSLEAKLGLALDYEVAGFAAWRIGHEDPDNWRLISNLETPATPVSPPVSTDTLYFEETGHTLTGVFRDYWESNGGLAKFGYPRTEPFVEYDPMTGQSYTVQYFERVRMEHHPEFEGTEYEVLLGHIGRWAMAQRGIDPWETAVQHATDGRTYFPESGHSLGGTFLDYWQANGGLMYFGYPISEKIQEYNVEDGGTYTVQYFERARMELHTDPETGGTMVLLGLLGNEMLRERGWIR